MSPEETIIALRDFAYDLARIARNEREVNINDMAPEADYDEEIRENDEWYAATIAHVFCLSRGERTVPRPTTLAFPDDED